MQHNFSLSRAVEQARNWRNEEYKIVFTNGVFDLLHLGHITYLNQAKSLGNKLIVGVNSDISSRLLDKGPARPIKDEISRASILESLESVDLVVLFNEATPLKTILAVRPDILVKGGDYDADVMDEHNKKYIVGSKEVREQGGDVRVIKFLQGYSTTAIEEKIIQAHSKDLEEN
ncbi:MAG TPA: D-glycero-beta-D-manno-heptose 1-phosphate adenylyltransferase [Flavobacteriales bacterium]|jgi:rfaE bifunctional protein nucleotidyltransferase chain/domain|nr:D-glycero-beta-D-manno-heptose 1-phosphate adenylyltransferase [Flavobacteriales bacterium]